jgi:hypothetical protein
VTRLHWGVLALALAISGGLALFASESPDGLEHSMHQVGVGEGEALIEAPMPDYELSLLQNPTARKVAAGLSGTLAVFGLSLLAGWSLRRPKPDKDPGPE